MSEELSEFYRDWNQAKKDKKWSNLERSTQLLIDRNIDFESKNGGVHLIINGENIL